MKTTFENVVLAGLILLGACTSPKKDSSETMTTSPETTADEWIVLFDGTNFDQWQGYNNKGAMHSAWTIEEEGSMKFTPSKEGGKNIVTKEEFTSFVLSIDWKISEGGNSGIFWSVFEDSTFNEAYQTGPEIQVLDNERHPDAQANPKYHQAGALYDMVQPSADVCNPAGEWNNFVITVDHNENTGSVELNGTKIVEFEPHGDKWDAMVAKSKFADWTGFGEYRTGKIGLQDHGDIVYYRDIKIKEL